MRITATGPSSRGTRRNGLRNPHDYTYRGTRTLETELPYECGGGCGRRVERAPNQGLLCAVCRGSSALGSEDRR